MNRKESAYLLAKYLCNPVDGIEIGGVSEQLLDIIKTLVKGDGIYRRNVLDWLYYFCDEDDERYDKLRDDYDRIFYNR